MPLPSFPVRALVRTVAPLLAATVLTACQTTSTPAPYLGPVLPIQ